MNFSVIIVTYNRASLLNKFIYQVGKIHYPVSKYEVIIVDNGSTDHTKNICMQAEKILPNIRYIYEHRGGQSYARNRGISAATNTHLLFLDDDEIFSPNILHDYSSAWKQYPQAFIIGGKIIARIDKSMNNTTPTIPLAYHWMIGEIDYGNKTKRLMYPDTLFTGNFSILNNLKSKNKPAFNTRLGRRILKYIQLGGEDYEFCLRTHLQHRKIIYIPVTVYNNITRNRLTLWYKLLRSLLAGLERRIIDKNLITKYPTHQKFQLIFRNMYNDILYIAFCFGYYGLGLLF